MVPGTEGFHLVTRKWLMIPMRSIAPLQHVLQNQSLCSLQVSEMSVPDAWFSPPVACVAPFTSTKTRQ